MWFLNPVLRNCSTNINMKSQLFVDNCLIYQPKAAFKFRNDGKFDECKQLLHLRIGDNIYPQTKPLARDHVKPP